MMVSAEPGQGLWQGARQGARQGLRLFEIMGGYVQATE